jgi:hypothetical protein
MPLKWKIISVEHRFQKLSFSLEKETLHLRIFYKIQKLLLGKNRNAPKADRGIAFCLLTFRNGKMFILLLGVW